MSMSPREQSSSEFSSCSGAPGKFRCESDTGVCLAWAADIADKRADVITRDNALKGFRRLTDTPGSPRQSEPADSEVGDVLADSFVLHVKEEYLTVELAQRHMITVITIEQ